MDGRYTHRKQNEKNGRHPRHASQCIEFASSNSHSSQPQGQQPQHTASAPKTASDPDISFDIERLLSAEQGCCSESDSGGARDSCSSAASASQTLPGSQQGIRFSFTGESWFASYVLSTSMASPIELHRPVERRTEEPRQDDNDNSSGSPLSGGITSLDLPQHLTMRLTDAYFSLFHAFCPILDQAYFLASVRDGGVSVTLLRCVLFVASIHCPLELIFQMGYSSRLDAESDLFNKACASFDTEQESNRTTMILSSYLLQYWSGNATKYRDTLWWLGNSIRSAQCMGFHRSTKNSKMPERTKIHWKRIWWCLYIRDRQVSLSTGPPMVISDIDFDVEDLTMDDFPDEPPETARYMIAQVSLNKAASNMFFCHCSPRRLALSHDPQARREARRQIQTVLEGWYAHVVLPSNENEKHFLNLILKVCYQ